jgi:glycolate oxidase FAD binding subunit
MTIPTANQLRGDLNQIVGEVGILPDEQLNQYRVDDLVPQAVVLPASNYEIRDVLIYAADRKLSVVPAGSGTKLGIGNPPEKVDLVLSTLRLNDVLEYEPGDLTVTVQAGIRLADLQTKLAENGQCLPLDPPYADRATVGGITAANSSGPSRLRYGTPRNWVLGMRMVQSSGTVVKSGGKVVKNVAGYDLNKLYIGSFGTLGVITELSFKLNPLPEIERTVLLTFGEIPQASRVALEITGSQLVPTFLNLFVNGVPSTEISEPCLVIGLDGHPETVEWQINQAWLMAEQNGAMGVEVYDGVRQRDLWASMRAFPECSWTQQMMICKANLRVTDVEGFINTTLTIGNDLHGLVQVMGLMGNGVVYVAFSELAEGTDLVQSVASAIDKLRNHALGIGGNLIVEFATTEVKRQIDIWGPIGSGIKLMKQIKARLDPIGLLNPGRFVSEI